MRSLDTKLVLVALGFAILATPALAQSTRPRQVRQDYDVTQRAPVAQPSAPDEHYPNGALKSGSEGSFESGAEFNLSN